MSAEKIQMVLDEISKKDIADDPATMILGFELVKNREEEWDTDFSPEINVMRRKLRIAWILAWVQWEADKILYNKNPRGGKNNSTVIAMKLEKELENHDLVNTLSPDVLKIRQLALDRVGEISPYWDKKNAAIRLAVFDGKDHTKYEGHTRNGWEMTSQLDKQGLSEAEE